MLVGGACGGGCKGGGRGRPSSCGLRVGGGRAGRPSAGVGGLPCCSWMSVPSSRSPWDHGRVVGDGSNKALLIADASIPVVNCGRNEQWWAAGSGASMHWQCIASALTVRGIIYVHNSVAWDDLKLIPLASRGSQFSRKRRPVTKREIAGELGFHQLADVLQAQDRKSRVGSSGPPGGARPAWQTT